MDYKGEERCRGENCACGIFELVIFDSCCIVKFVELQKPLVLFFESEESDCSVFRIVVDCCRIVKDVEWNCGCFLTCPQLFAC